MKKLITTLTLVATLCSANLSYAADRYVTLVKAGGDTSSVSQAIAADEVVTCVLAHSGKPNIGLNVDVIIGAITIPIGHISTYRTSHSNATGTLGFYQWSIAGPCTVRFTGSPLVDANNIITLKISPNPNIMGVKQ